MSSNTSGIVSKVWSFCNTLRDDGVGYGDYLEQLTYLLFLKMADEYSKPPHNRPLPLPLEYNWESLTAKRGAELEGHYTTLLRELGKQKGILGQIFTKSQNKIQDPAKLYKLIDMIDKEQWSLMGADVKGAKSTVYKQEELLDEYKRTPVDTTVAYVPCVRCGKIMNRKNFGKISGIIIDECSKHGVWLDAGELEKIRHFIADGGLERLQDREIEKNRNELEMLAIKVERIDFTQRLIHFWNIKRWLFG